MRSIREVVLFRIVIAGRPVGDVNLDQKLSVEAKGEMLSYLKVLCKGKGVRRVTVV